MTRLLDVDPRQPVAAALDEAASVLKSGGLVAFPTESFYGLGADALNAEAVERVFRIKGRPASKPLLVLVDGIERVEALCVEISEGARALMARHWPGPLTLVLRAAPGVPLSVTAGTGTLGLRVPGHPVALGLARAAAVPVTAPSANPSGADPSTTAEAVRGYFEGQVDLILAAGPTAGGAGSTVADCTAWPPRVVRQGSVRL
ncbi:MAG: L-threonylcarbamoyladenylate synthase [candidate division NC10 bacterium]